MVICVWVILHKRNGGIVYDMDAFFMPYSLTFILDYLLIGSLIILYTSVGISLGSNRKVFKYIKVLGFRVIYISIAIFLGSITGGFIAGTILAHHCIYP